MSAISRNLRRWVNPANGEEGLTYWCEGCQCAHSIRTKGASAWGWNDNAEKPVFAPSVLTTWTEGPQHVEKRCHTFVGCNGAQPGEVIFLSDCTHSLAGRVRPFAELPDWLKG